PLVDADFFITDSVDASMIAVPVPGQADVKVSRPPHPSVFAVPTGYSQIAQGKGNGDALQLTTSALTEDCIVFLRAHKDHAQVAPIPSDLQLPPTAAILVRPDTMPGLSLQITPSTDGQSGELLVSGGQAGVFYHF